MSRLLIINLHSTSNAGDHALLLMSLRAIYAFSPDAQITLSVNDPAGFAANQLAEPCVPSFFGWAGGERRPGWLPRLRLLIQLYLCGLWAALRYRWSGKATYAGIPRPYRSLLRAYFEADAVLSCPGNFIYTRSYLAGLPILVPLFAMFYAWLLGKPFALLPQTVGPLSRRWEGWVVGWVLRRASRIAVRDVTSVALLERLGFGKETYLVIPDLAFQFPGAGREAGMALLQEFGIEPSALRPRLGVTLINWGAQNPAFGQQLRYEAGVTETIRRFLAETGGEALLFSQVCGPTSADDDRIPARRVAAALAAAGVTEGVHLIDAAIPAPRLKAAYGLMDLFLGSRLHSNIFALAEGVPVLAIAYQDKTFGVMGMLGLGEWVLSIEESGPESLGALYSRFWPRRQEVRSQAQRAVQALQQEIDHKLGDLFAGLLTPGQGRASNVPGEQGTNRET